MGQSVEHHASGRDIPVFLLEQPRAGRSMSRSGDLEQPRGTAVRLVNDAVALRQGEDVALASTGSSRCRSGSRPTLPPRSRPSLAVVRKGSVVAPGSSCTRKQSISAIPGRR